MDIASHNAAIKRLGRLEQQSFSGRRRFQFYNYLSELLEYYRRLEKSGELLAVRDFLLRRPNCRSKSSDPIRVLIDATSRACTKTKSRWTRALQFALDRRGEWHGRMTAKQFFRTNGGVAGCARKIAVRRPRTLNKPREQEVPEFRDWK